MCLAGKCWKRPAPKRVYLIQICDARGFDCNKVAIYILFEANSGEV